MGQYLARVAVRTRLRLQLYRNSTFNCVKKSRRKYLLRKETRLHLRQLHLRKKKLRIHLRGLQLDSNQQEIITKTETALSDSASLIRLRKHIFGGVFRRYFIQRGTAQSTRINENPAHASTPGLGHCLKTISKHGRVPVCINEGPHEMTKVRWGGASCLSLPRQNHCGSALMTWGNDNVLARLPAAPCKKK